MSPTKLCLIYSRTTRAFLMLAEYAMVVKFSASPFLSRFHRMLKVKDCHQYL